jgi:Alginate lyase
MVRGSAMRWVVWMVAVVGFWPAVGSVALAQRQPAKGYGPPQFQEPVLAPVALDGFVFRHPMTVIDREELDEVKRRIAAHVEPQATAYAKLIADADAALSFHPDPPDLMKIMGGYEPNSNQDTVIRPWLWRNCHAAYASALAYVYTGDTRYADKAVEVLNAWAKKGTRFEGGDRGLQLGSWFTPMLYAADLLHDYSGWKAGDRKKFAAWWRRDCLAYTLETMHGHSNNWKDAGVLGVLSAAVVLEDEALMADGLAELRSYFQDRTDDHVKEKGAWKFHKGQRGVFLPEEVTRNNGSSGITYTGYSLTTMVQALEIARYAGHDYWHLQTPEGAGLQGAIEWYFKWDVLRWPFPWNGSPLHFETRKNVFEVANDRFHLMPEVEEWLKKNRPVNGEQGDEYSTLNKGEMPEGQGSESRAQGSRE